MHQPSGRRTPLQSTVDRAIDYRTSLSNRPYPAIGARMPIARIASQVHAWVLVTTDLPESFSMRSITDAVRHLLQGR